MEIGILAVQGAFAEHAAMLDRLGTAHFEIRQRRDIERSFDGLILPGGESTVISKLLRDLELFGPLQARIQDGMPVFGTCAGLILLAKTVDGGTPCFGTMDISAKRNAYGRQLGSFHVKSDFHGVGTIPMTFIRAPYIQSAGPGVVILSELDGHIVAARQGNQLAAAFHPELDETPAVHQYFLKMIQDAVENATEPY